MDRHLGQIELVAWQGRRLRGVRRLGPVDTILLVIFALSLFTLALRFGADLAVPLGLLQAAFALAVTSAALLGTRWIVAAILWLQQR